MRKRRRVRKRVGKILVGKSNSILLLLMVSGPSRSIRKRSLEVVVGRSVVKRRDRGSLHRHLRPFRKEHL